MSRERKRSQSDPTMLAARLERAKAEGKPVDLDYDEVTGVIDCALERGQKSTEKDVGALRRLTAKINATPTLPKPA